MAKTTDQRTPLASPHHPVPHRFTQSAVEGLSRSGPGALVCNALVRGTLGRTARGAFLALAVAAASASLTRGEWVDITPGNLTVSPMQIGFDLTDADRIFVGSYGDGLFRSENSGQTWNQIYLDFYEGDGVATVLVNDVEFAPGNPSQGIAITLSGSYFTDDGGLTWHRHPDNNVGDGPAIGYDLVAIPDGSGLVASEIGDPSVGGAPWVYLWATDSWSPLHPMFLGVAGASTLGLGFDASDPSILYIGNTFRNFWTADLGATLNNNSAGLSDNNSRVVMGDPEVPGRVLCGVDGGLFLQTTPGGGWTSFGAGLAGPIWAMVHHPDDPDLMFAGTQDGVFQSDNRGASWTLMDHTGLPFTKVMDLGIHPDKSQILYATVSDGTAGGGGVFYLEFEATSSAPLVALADPGQMRISPNPGTDHFVIEWVLPGTGTTASVSSRKSEVIRIYDATGRRIVTLPTTAERTVAWNGRDDAGRTVPTGTYFVRMTSRIGGPTVLTESVRVIR